MAQENETPKPVAALSHVTTAARPGQAGLHDVSFTLHAGEILTLLGIPGASGIATILDLFAGFAHADSGEVIIGRRLLDATPTHARPIGLVTRTLSLFPHLDVAGHAGFAPGATKAQANAILQRLELSAFARRRPHALPPDIQFRVALARALSSSPSVLLLDHRQAARLKPLLRALAAETGLVILHATEDAAASFGLSDRIAVIQSGRISQIGTPQQVYDQPASLAVAGAMGPLNRLAGTVLDCEDDIARIRLSGGAVVEARAIEPLEAGHGCVIALRPERIAVASVVADDLGEGAVPARLIETVFAGDHVRLRFSLDSRGGAAPEVTVIRPAGAIPPRGKSVCLAWQPHHAHAFPTEAA